MSGRFEWFELRTGGGYRLVLSYDESGHGRSTSGTRVEIRADDVPSGISAEDHAVGLVSSLANLADFLADYQAR